jgi:hypothetical protein
MKRFALLTLVALAACNTPPDAITKPTVEFTGFVNSVTNMEIPANSNTVPANFVAQVNSSVSSSADRVTDVQCFKGATPVTAGVSYKTECGYAGVTSGTVIKATATSAGGTSETSKTVNVDSTAPQASSIVIGSTTLTNPVTGSLSAFVPANSSVDLSVSSSDLDVLQTYIRIGSTIIARENGSTAFATIKIGNAPIDVVFGVIDKVGNISQYTVAVAISKVDSDTTPPVVSINTPLPDPATGKIVLSVTANDSSGVADVTLLVNGTPLATDSAAPYTFSIDTTLYDNGPVNLQARATDSVGNVSANTDPIQITIANARLPEISITSPTNQGILTGNTAVTVSVVKRGTPYTFTSPVTVEVLDYRGTQVAFKTIATPGGTGPVTFVQASSEIDFNSFPIDAYIIRARVTVDVDPPGPSDGDGELSTQIGISNNNTSNQPPALQILSPLRLNQEQTTVPAMIQRSGIVVADLSDNSGLASVELRVTCDSGCGTLGPINALEQYQAFDPPPSQARVFLKYDADATPYLPEGKYTFRVVAQDVQGNRNIQEIKAEINRSGADSPPAPPLVETIVNGPRAAISDTVDLCHGSATYSISGIPTNARVYFWVFDPNGKVVQTGSSIGNVSVGQAFTFEGNWTFNAIVQEFSGNLTVVNTGATVGVNKIKPTDPCP